MLMIPIVVVNHKVFQPHAQLPIIWLIITLSISSSFGIVGGYVTALIAQVEEIKHAIGLVIFSLILAVCFMCVGSYSLPHWYRILGILLVVPTVLLGGWLRAKQRLNLEEEKKKSGLRLVVGMFAAFVTFVIIVFLVTALGGTASLMLLQSFLGEDFYGIVFVPMFIVSVCLAFVLSRYVLRKINASERI